LTDDVIASKKLSTKLHAKKTLTVLQQVFGFDSFRGCQEEVITAVLSGYSAFVLMPTGGGKSLCYQIPALCGMGPVVVVSPLIALMENQVAALRMHGVKAAFLNSSLSAVQANQVQSDFAAGHLDLLYLAPERLVMPETRQMLHQASTGLFAIDEAHCLSQWGHDFREDYLALSMLADEFPGIPRIALTATADERTRSEICRHLDFRADNSVSFVESFDRPNLFYEIAASNDRRGELIQFIKDSHDGDTGIVYCLTRKSVDETADFLSSQGIRALPYHAGMSADARKANQTCFLNENAVVIVATIAFGMGIDKPDVRFVAHLNLPRNIEAYSQESGRAGRDGKPAVAWMRYSLQDVISLRHMLRQSQASDLYKQVISSKLETMLGFAEMIGCRRRLILEYFGENNAEDCGNCDNCINPPKTYDATVAVQKALSCVFRTGQRYGVKYVIDVLTGASNERILKAGHDQISTYGIGSELTTSQWQSLFRQIISRGYLHADLDNYGILQLTEAARDVLKGREQVELRESLKRTTRKSRKKTNKKTQSHDLEDAAVPMFDAMKSVRSELAREQGLAPFMVFHDATLIEMVKRRPVDAASMLEISGVGEKKLERFGDAFLAEIARFEKN